jgi:hypothetical protein
VAFGASRCIDLRNYLFMLTVQFSAVLQPFLKVREGGCEYRGKVQRRAASKLLCVVTQCSAVKCTM